jgi:hypothetical protein
MADTIKDGAGSGYQLKVDADNRAHIQSLSISYEDFAVLNGDSFGVLGSVVTLTTGTISYLLYVNNDNTHDIVISNLEVSTGVSTGGANTDWLLTIQVSPTGGTLISGGSAGAAVNNNLGSAKVLDVTVLTGVEGSTATGGVTISRLFSSVNGISRLDQKLVIPAGTSLAVGLTPPTSNTSVSASASVTLIKQTLDLE